MTKNEVLVIGGRITLVIASYLAERFVKRN